MLKSITPFFVSKKHIILYEFKLVLQIIFTLSLRNRHALSGFNDSQFFLKFFQTNEKRPQFMPLM